MNVTNASFLLAVVFVWVLALPTRRVGTRQALFLSVSYLFYATWGLGFLAILIASSLLNFSLGAWIRRSPTGRRLVAGISADVLLLGFFKYLPPIAGHLPGGGFLHVAMPVGISFWTFQAISYLFDLYREEDVRPTLLEFCLYMAFWPTVLAGPVCRLPEMLPRFRTARTPGWDDVSVGTYRIVVGLFMKVVLAQLLATGFNPGEGVNYGFDIAAKGAGGFDVWMLAIGFGFQLFFDFAGYSNIVIGVARLFGIELRENFNRPYLSTNPSLFWTRWHMSLSSWIRDYVFMPLAVVRRQRWWREVALVVSMVTFGFWHGATAPFLLWGVYHGVILAGHREAEAFWRKRGWKRGKVVGAAGWAFTFGAVSLGWIFFRAGTLGEAAAMWRQVLNPSSYLSHTLRPNYYIVTTLLALGYFAWVGFQASLARLSARYGAIRQGRWVLSPVVYALAIILIVAWSGKGSLFVYFQF